MPKNDKKPQNNTADSIQKTIEQRVDDFHYQIGQGSLFTKEEEAKAGVSDKTRSIEGSLAEAEQLLDTILSDNKKRWVEIYRVLCDVRDSEAYKSAFGSFSGWLQNYAKRSNTSAQILWKYYRCGNYYQKIEEVQKQKEHRLDLKAEDLSPDNMVLIGKITKNDPQRGGALAMKTVRGELGRKGLQAMWNREKMERKHRGEKMTCINGYDSYENGNSASSSARMTAGQIVSALCSDYLWLPGIVTPRPPYCRNTYLCIPEFPVRTAEKTRHLDLLIAENLTAPTADANFQVTLHGIEIKVDRYDLERDDKMQEYPQFVDLFWLAIPEGDDELYAAASDLLQDNPGWGLLLITSSGSAKVAQKADKSLTPTAGLLTKDTLMTFVNKANIPDRQAVAEDNDKEEIPDAN